VWLGGPVDNVGQNVNPVVAGTVACVSGDCWIRLMNKPGQTTNLGGTGAPIFGAVSTLTEANDGLNPLITDPRLINPLNPTFIDGWIHLPTGMPINFGSDPASDTAPRDPVVEIDVFCTVASEVSIFAH
jgi:hypothetical protein